MGFLKRLLFGEETVPQSHHEPDFTDEVEGLLICIGQNCDTSRSAIEGSLQMLDYLNSIRDFSFSAKIG